MAKRKESLEQTQESKDSLKLALEKLEKDYGVGTVISAGFKPQFYDIISSGSLELDIALGVGGWARGKIVELIGWESSGKSTLTYEAIAQAQNKNIKCVLIDGEHSFDPKYAKAIGVNVEDLIINQPDYGEQGYDVALKLMETGKIGLVVIDSQTALRPKKEIDGEVGASQLGLHARLMSEVMPKILGAAARNNVLVIFISQLREKIGVMFGSPETTNGGHALKFYAHVRARCSKTVLKEGDDAVSNKTTVKIIKNKLAPPFRIAEFNIVYGVGVDRMSELIKVASDLNVINKSGSWYSYGDSKIGQGSEAVATFLSDNPEVANEIRTKVMNLVSTGQADSVIVQGAPESEDFEEPAPEIKDAVGDVPHSMNGFDSDENTMPKGINLNN